MTGPAAAHRSASDLACPYHQVGRLAPIASSPEDYVQKAVRLGHDANFDASVRAAISEQSHILFNDRATVVAFKGFFRFAQDTLE